jgi:type III secretory pathway component EscR
MMLVELVIFHILGNMEDEKIFSILSSMQSKLWNQLARPFNITICIFVKNFFTNELFLSNMLLQIGMMETRQRLE